jgi:hypothetical protein
MADIHRAAYYVRVFNKAGRDWWQLVPADAERVTDRCLQLGDFIIFRDRSNVWQAVSRVGDVRERRDERAA